MSVRARTRFAPSPTGDLHIGGVRTAIFSWLLARHTGGEFYLRVEDTDQERYVPGATRRILEAFDWLGLTLDGGPDHDELRAMRTNEDYPGALDDGEYKGIPGPFVQSHRLHLYKQWAEWLVAHGYAYRANETPEELQRMRAEAQARKQTFIFREEMRLRTDVRADEPHVIRMRVLPRSGRTEFDDLIKGRLSFDNAQVDDQVLLKMDGFPTYHLAVVVDDHLQGVTHVLRGDDWLPSAPKHVLLYRYFGWPEPQWAHVPNVLGTDGKKLSKRHGAQSVFEFRDQGYIPEALINFLALLGWAPGGGDEQNVFTREELIAKFSMEGIGSSPAVFDYNKLDWLNGVHIRRLPAEDLAARLVPFLARAGILVDTPEQRARLLRIVPHVQERIKKLTDAAPLVDFFFSDIHPPPAEMLVGPKMDRLQSLEALRETRRVVAEVEPFEDALLEQALRALCQALGLKPTQLFTVVRNAVTGKSVTPPLFATMAILGRKTCLIRLDRAIARLQSGM
ncbi:MAG: glutamate--tRNA ligase [Chloroflexi bacterium]|uniref:Glutamate--tRNA ligase n=1 Tax=Candidatus Thermofonsia Clade 3 bacterium TaxID=2364212 RepID=A0A2M8QDU0_9CHLR|nr:glutamate--tRNA ligase [Candidatus Roseilinea sp. NK_OTU-006]PJF47960.1 MAG: glutamate--tRNA ligase [Candidatus Thermofonsia Clade 3 bacterium]RMG65313.1 MAG: glutamate--tRNA ligase [Chloroflexota bacterium]